MSCDENENNHERFKSLRYCFVPSCKNNSWKHASKNFFAVPVSCKNKWCEAVGYSRSSSARLYVCEDHLNLKEDVENYQYWITTKGRARLKPILPQSLLTVASTSSLHHDNNETGPNVSASDKATNCEDILTYNKAIQVKPKTADRTTHCTILKRHKDKSATEELFLENKDMEFMIMTQESTTSADFISEDSTASETYIKDEKVGRMFILKLIKEKPYLYIGLPNEYYWIIDYLAKHLKISSFEIIITLYKLKTNTLFTHIADIFQVSLTTLWRMFSRTLCVLSKFFKQFIFCPKPLNVKQNLPSSFRTNKENANVYCIIDCFEIEIEKPSNPVNQALTWSQYKNSNTLKYLVATTPDGFVCFVSEGFGGRTSDVNILQNSGLLDVLPPNCTVLADRGFKHIDTILHKKHLKLLRPPSVPKNTKLSKPEAIKSKVIASLRVHVERVIRRVRIFKFLKPHSVINNKLINNTDDAINVACGLINLQSSIIQNE